MNSRIEIDIIDKDGWRKTCPIQKSIFHIGSNPANDIVLEMMHGAGVSARHAQFIALPDGSGYRMVNLGDSNILLSETRDTSVPPHSVAAVNDGSTLKIGDFTLIFHGEAIAKTITPASIRDGNIGLRLRLPKTQLLANRTLTGAVIVSNQGDQSGVQFNLELEGLAGDCFSLEPAPILPSGSEAEVVFHFYHRGNKPLAGEHTITIRAIAPYAYPNEEATVTSTIQVQPHFRYSLQPVPIPAPPTEPSSSALPPVNATPPPAPMRAREVETSVNVEAGWDEPKSTVDISTKDAGMPKPSKAAQPEKRLAQRDVAQVPEPEEVGNETPPEIAIMATGEVLPAPPETIAAEKPVAIETSTEPIETTERSRASESASAPAPDDEWKTASEESPQEPNERPDVITLKAAPPTVVENVATTTPPAVHADDDWWSEPDDDAPVANADWWSESQANTPTTDE